MAYFNIYIKSELEIEQLAESIRAIINCNSKNQTEWQIDQCRYGENYGGTYYLFEIIGLELKLIKNAGEVFESTFPEYEYYIICSEMDNIDAELFHNCIVYIANLLKRKGLHNIVIEM